MQNLGEGCDICRLLDNLEESQAEAPAVMAGCSVAINAISTWRSPIVILGPSHCELLKL